MARRSMRADLLRHEEADADQGGAVAPLGRSPRWGWRRSASATSRHHHRVQPRCARLQRLPPPTRCSWCTELAPNRPRWRRRPSRCWAGGPHRGISPFASVKLALLGDGRAWWREWYQEVHQQALATKSGSRWSESAPRSPLARRCRSAGSTARRPRGEGGDARHERQPRGRKADAIKNEPFTPARHQRPPSTSRLARAIAVSGWRSDPKSPAAAPLRAGREHLDGPGRHDHHPRIPPIDERR